MRNQVRDTLQPVIDRAVDLATPGVTATRTSGTASGGASPLPSTRQDAEGRSVRPMFWGLDNWGDPEVQWFARTMPR